MRAMTPVARYAEVGMPVRSQAPGWSHVIQEVHYDVRAEKWRIKTNQGEWLFHGDEKVTFPRRRDGSTVDWRRSERVPTIGDVYVRDVLHEPVDPPNRMQDPRLDPRYGEAPQRVRDRVETEWLNHGQIVAAVTDAPNSDGHVFVITTRSVIHGNGRYFFRDTDPITFPHEYAAERRSEGHQMRALDAWGPYQLSDGRYALLCKHPNGVGRWPAWLRNPVSIGKGVVIAKPPGKGEPWPTFLGSDSHGSTYDRHPRDPQWGINPADETVDQGLINEVMETYEQYKKRYERRG